MADVVWPPSLTRGPRCADLSETPPEIAIRTQMEAGPAKARARLLSNSRTFSMSMDVTRTGLAVFDTFFVSSTKGGAVEFEWKNPRTGNTADFRFVSQPKYGEFKPRADGTEWCRVEFVVELLAGTEQTNDEEPPAQDIVGGGGGEYGPEADAGGGDGDEEAESVEEIDGVWLPVFEADTPPPMVLIVGVTLSEDGEEMIEDSESASASIVEADSDGPDAGDGVYINAGAIGGTIFTVPT